MQYSGRGWRTESGSMVILAGRVSPDKLRTYNGARRIGMGQMMVKRCRYRRCSMSCAYGGWSTWYRRLSVAKWTHNPEVTLLRSIEPNHLTGQRPLSGRPVVCGVDGQRLRVRKKGTHRVACATLRRDACDWLTPTTAPATARHRSASRCSACCCGPASSPPRTSPHASHLA